MQIELLPHLDEIYIRRYSDDCADTSEQACPASVVDVPMTLRVADANFYLTCRRDVDGRWVAFCDPRERARLLSVFLARDVGSAEERLHAVLQQAVKAVRQVIAGLPDPLTRRDAVERMILAGDARILLERSMPGTPFQVRLLCMPSLHMLLSMWNSEDSSLRDARSLGGSQWQQLGEQIEIRLVQGDEEGLMSLLLNTLYPQGLPATVLQARQPVSL